MNKKPNIVQILSSTLQELQETRELIWAGDTFGADQKLDKLIGKLQTDRIHFVFEPEQKGADNARD